MENSELWRFIETGDAEGLKSYVESLEQVNLSEHNEKGHTLLVAAVKRNDLATLKMLLFLGADPSELTFGEKMLSAMHVAAKKNRVEMMKELYQAGVSVDVAGSFDGDSVSPLVRATSGSAFEAIEWLLDNGANVNGIDRDTTPLNYAVFSLSIPVVKKLIDKGADVNLADEWGNTPLMEAALLGSVELTKTLVEYGKADIMRRSTVGATALDEAIRHEMWEVAHYLWMRGCPCSNFRPSATLVSDPTCPSTSESSSTRSLLTKSNAEKVSNATWIRPYIANVPPPRYKCALESVGSVLYAYGGLGIEHKNTEEMHCYNPDMRVKGTDSDLSDFWKLDFCAVEHVDMSGKFLRAACETNRLDDTLLGPGLEVVGELQDEVTLMQQDALQAVSVDASNVRAVKALDPREGFGYFEVTVEQLDTEGCVAIGVVSAEVDATSLPGWNVDSFALHSDDGRAFHNSSFGLPWGRRYYAGDTVGCGVDFASRELFFTLNGQFLGVAYRHFEPQPLYPSIGFRTQAAKAKFNFGKAPFLFDFQLTLLRWQSLPSVALSYQTSSPCHFVKSKGKLLLLDSQTSHQGPLPIFDPKSETWSYLDEPNITLPWQKNSHVQYDTIGETIYAIDAKAKHRTKSPSVWALDIAGRKTTRTIIVPMNESKRMERATEELEKVQLEEDDEKDSDDEEDSNDSDSDEDSSEDGSESEGSGDEDEDGDDDDVSGEFAFKAGLTRISNLNDNDAVRLEMREKFSGCPVVALGGKLMLLSPTQLGVFDPKTGSLATHACSGSNPVSTYFSVKSLYGQLVTFGGWDSQNQRADLLFFNPDSKQWYKLHTHGIMPRPRSFHQSAILELPKEHPLLNSQSHINIQESGLHTTPSSTSNSSKSIDTPLKCLVLFGGWSGHSHLNDLEVLVPSLKFTSKSTSSMFVETVSEDLAQKVPNENRETSLENHGNGISPKSVTFRVLDPKTGERVTFVTDAILVASRSKKMRDAILKAAGADLEVSAHVHLFRSLLTFLWDDNIDFDYDHDEAKVFFDLVSFWAEEHSERVSEALLMNSLYKASRWSLDLEFAFNNPLFSDIDLVFGSRTIKAHKCLLKQNPYFNQLFSSGMLESNSSSIDMTQHIAVGSSLHGQGEEEIVYRLGSALVRYIYTKEINLEGLEDDIDKIFQLSDKYQVLTLKAHLESILCFNLSESNVVSIMQLAMANNAPRTVRACTIFIANHPGVEGN